LKNSFFFARYCFYVINIYVKYREKFQPLGHLSGRVLEKKLRFCAFRSKNQTKLRLSRNST